MRGRPRGRPPTKRHRHCPEASGATLDTRNAPSSRSYKSPGQVNLVSGLRRVLEMTRDHKDAWLFAEPVNEVVCPGYSTVVKEPMDLSLIAKRVEDGIYTSREEFVKDFKRMVENCAFYNGLQSEVAGKGYCLWMAMLDGMHTVLGSEDPSNLTKLYIPGTISTSKTTSNPIPRTPRSERTTSQDSDNRSDLDEMCAAKNCRVAKRRSVPIQRQRRRKRIMTARGKYDTSDSDELYVPRFVRSSTRSEPLKRHLRSDQGKMRPDSDASDLDRLYVPDDIPIAQTKSKPIQRQSKGEEKQVLKEQDAPIVKRKRGRPPKSVSRSILKPRPPKDPAMEALSSATRKALEDSADLTYDLCRLDGSLETSSDVIGYFPDLKIGGTQSHPSELLSKLCDVEEQSGGYTIAEGTAITSNLNHTEDSPCDKIVDKTDLLEQSANVQPNAENAAQVTELQVAGNETSQIEEPTGSTVCGTGDAKASSDLATDQCSESKESNIIIDQSEVVLAPESPESAAAPDTPRGNDTEQSDGEERRHLAHMSSCLDQLVQLATKADGDEIEDRLGTLDLFPVRCKSVPPLHFKYAERTAGKLLESITSALVISRLQVQEDCKACPECRNSDAGAPEDKGKQTLPAEHLIARPEQIPEVCFKSPGTEATEPRHDSQSSLPDRDKVLNLAQSPNPTSPKQDSVVLPDDSRAHSEEKDKKDKQLPRSPKLPADLQSLENECLYCVDSPKSSFSFSSGYLSEDTALSPMRYHRNSPLPQLSPSRLSPLLPTGASSLQKICELVAEIPVPPKPAIPGRLLSVATAASYERRDRLMLKPSPEQRTQPNCNPVQPTVQPTIPRPIPTQPAAPHPSVLPVPQEPCSFFIPSANPISPFPTAMAFPTGATPTFSNGAATPIFYNLGPAPWNNVMPQIQWSYPSVICQQGGMPSQAYCVPQTVLSRNIFLDAPWLQQRPMQQQQLQPMFQHQLHSLQNGPASLQPASGAGRGPAPNEAWVRAPSHGHQY
ncbi:unnamed protein product, partial [Ixodes hexagonus]